MKSTKELFGDVPNEVWAKQLELAEMRISLADIKLKKRYNQKFKDRELHKEAQLIKAISFWRKLKEEAERELNE